MQLYNIGLIAIKDEKHTDLLVKAINESGMLSDYETIDKTDLIYDNDNCVLFTVDGNGDIEPYLDKIADVFAENNCSDTLFISINYTGDADGYYEMENGHVISMTSGEHYLRNISNEELQAEIERRKKIGKAV